MAGRWTKTAIRQLVASARQQGRTVDEVAAEVQTATGVSRLAAWRLAADMSQPEAAAAFQAASGERMDQALLSRLENFPHSGGRTPTAAQLLAMATVYGASSPRQLLDTAAMNALPAETRSVLTAASGAVQTLTLDADVAPAGLTSHRLIPTAIHAPTDDPGGHILMAAERARRLIPLMEAPNVGPETLAELEAEAARLAAAYPQQPLNLLLPDLVFLQEQVFTLIEGRQPPARARDLLVLASLTSGMLAKASHDLGDPRSALTHARLSALCAENAGHSGLQAWATGLKSLVSYWAGRPHDAVTFARTGLAHAATTRGSMSMWLPALEARGLAVLGAGEETDDALNRAEEARQHSEPDELDAIGGILSFPAPRQHYYAADARVWLTDHAEQAEQDAAAALTGYATAPARDRAFGDEAGAAADLAMARLARGELEGAAEAVRPVLDMPPEQRIGGVCGSVARVQAALRASQHADAPAARELTSAMEEFTRQPIGSVLALPR